MAKLWQKKLYENFILKAPSFMIFLKKRNKKYNQDGNP